MSDEANSPCECTSTTAGSSSGIIKRVWFAVFGDDNPNWRPQSYGYELWGTEAGFRFPMVKLLDYGAKRRELEESDNPFATVVLAHLDTQETRQNLGQRKDRKFGLVKRLLERGWDAERVRQLFNLLIG